MLSHVWGSVVGSVYDSMSLNSNFVCESPTVILEHGANQTDTVYECNTSAKITIDANSSLLTYNFSLNIRNNSSNLWEIRLECFENVNVARVNTTIVLHDNSTTSSEQISLSGGALDPLGNYCNLTSDSIIHIGVMDLVEASPEGATILQVHLWIRVPETTTHTLYTITFEFT
jgi:hypothetical protein